MKEIRYPVDGGQGVEEDAREKWNRRWRERNSLPEPLEVLSRHAHLLPPGGDALDVACGLGGNALFLAARAFRVQGWDVSEVAIERLNDEAARQGTTLQACRRDVLAEPPAAASFDVITVGHFWEAGLVAPLMAALRPGGLLFYQTFTRERVGSRGPSGDARRLGKNELLHSFSSLQILSYQEEGRVGDLAQGFRDEAWIVCRKPPPGGAS